MSYYFPDTFVLSDGPVQSIRTAPGFPSVVMDSSGLDLSEGGSFVPLALVNWLVSTGRTAEYIAGWTDGTWHYLELASQDPNDNPLNGDAAPYGWYGALRVSSRPDPGGGVVVSIATKTKNLILFDSNGWNSDFYVAGKGWIDIVGANLQQGCVPYTSQPQYRVNGDMVEFRGEIQIPSLVSLAAGSNFIGTAVAPVVPAPAFRQQGIIATNTPQGGIPFIGVTIPGTGITQRVTVSDNAPWPAGNPHVVNLAPLQYIKA